MAFLTNSYNLYEKNDSKLVETHGCCGDARPLWRRTAVRLYGLLIRRAMA